MSKSKILLIIISLFFLASCATSYQKLSLTGGYKDMQLQENVYKVIFKGNTRISKETVKNYALYRCAEVTLENAYDYFIILEDEGYDKIVYWQNQTRAKTTKTGRTYKTRIYGGQTHTAIKPRAVLVIQCFKGQKPKDNSRAFNAKELIKYLEPFIKKNIQKKKKNE